MEKTESKGFVKLRNMKVRKSSATMISVFYFFLCEKSRTLAGKMYRYICHTDGMQKGQLNNTGNIKKQKHSAHYFASICKI